VSCEIAQASMSARLDGESPAISARRLRAHLDQCAACTHYRAASEALADQLGLLRSSMRLAATGHHDEAIARLLPEVRSAGAALSAGSRPAFGSALRRRARGKRRWLIPLVPALMLVTAMPLGAAEPFHAPPKHPTLCRIEYPAPKAGPA
jgi:anti-sigma factor RsiW